MGSVYKRGETWWIRYSKDGQQFRKSSKSTVKTVAEAMLTRIENELLDSVDPAYRFGSVRISDLLGLVRDDYALNGYKSADRLEQYIAHLTRHLHNPPANKVTTQMLTGYRRKRGRDGASPATINRELSALRRGFRLALENTPPLVVRVPKFPIVKEDNARQGFFEHDQFERVRAALPEYLYGFITVGYKLGLREGEIRGLRWDMVDRREWCVRPGKDTATKKHRRVIYLDDELRQIFSEAFRSRRLDCPYVFHRDGRRVGSFRKSWATACRTAGVPGRIFHDLRRTAVRNMVRAGVPEAVAMRISGHRTRSVFERYNIVSERDLRDAARRVAEYNGK